VVLETDVVVPVVLVKVIVVVVPVVLVKVVVVPVPVVVVVVSTHVNRLSRPLHVPRLSYPTPHAIRSQTAHFLLLLAVGATVSYR
jgi:hypothetical protein